MLLRCTASGAGLPMVPLFGLEGLLRRLTDRMDYPGQSIMLKGLVGLVVRTVQKLACISEYDIVAIGLKRSVSSRYKARLSFRSTFNHHITITSNDHDSELTKGPRILTNPMSIPARSTVWSHKPAKDTRNVSSRRGVGLLGRTV